MALLVIKQAGWNMTRSDKVSGGIEIHTTMDMITWTETFYVNVIKTADNSSRVIMGRIGLAQPLDWGIARRHIEQFLLKLETALKSETKATIE